MKAGFGQALSFWSVWTEAELGVVVFVVVIVALTIGGVILLERIHPHED